MLRRSACPYAGGVELGGNLRAHWPSLDVILMSGYTDEVLVRRGILTGDFRYLQKPLDLATLARVLRARLDHEPHVGS